MEGGTYLSYTALPQGTQVLDEGQTGSSLLNPPPYLHRQVIAEARPLTCCNAPPSRLYQLTMIL